MKYTEEEKAKIRKSIADAEARVMAKIKARMIKLSKDKNFKKEIEDSLNATLKKAI